VADKAWGGVFDQATDRRVEEFTESVSFDRRLYAHDIDGSTAHAQMLAKVGLLTLDECRQIEQALQEIRQEIEQDRFPFRTELEDIHMHVERALIDRLGDVGRKLHNTLRFFAQIELPIALGATCGIQPITATESGSRSVEHVPSKVGSPTRQ